MPAVDFGLSPERTEVVQELAARAAKVDGIRAVVLGGSRCVGAHRPDSDVDLGLYYDDEDRLDLDALRALAEEVNDEPAPVVTKPWEWGRWVNGGAWLRVGGQRIDWIYRRVSHVEEVLHALRRGDVEVDWMQQPPFGFASIVYGGETHHCLALSDTGGDVARLKALVERYPERLRASLAQNWTWAADFALRKGAAFAHKGDVPQTVGCLSRACWFLGHVVHALERRWSFPSPTVPKQFEARVDAILSAAGGSPLELSERIDDAHRLLDEVAVLAGTLYQAPRFPS